MEGLRIVGQGIVAEKGQNYWCIDRDGVMIYIDDRNMMDKNPAVGNVGFLTYEYRNSAAMVNCFRSHDDPSVKDGLSTRENAPQPSEDRESH